MLLLALLLGLATPGPRFLPDDPVRVDRDDIPVAKPAEIELSTAYDVIEHTFFVDGPGRDIPRAANVNTLGEVPDSSWFTNRGPMTPEQFARGPAQTGGPAPGTWTITAGKSQGITPGFTIKDATGETWFVKFDPIPYPGLSTAADVMGTRFFHGLGYNVPENHLAWFTPDQLRIAETARIAVKGSKKQKMTSAHLEAILARVPRDPDGRIRCVASRRVMGEPIGPHKYHGVRPDDPNDVFPHQHRRDLRAYRVFSAWLNHDDSRSVNSIDTFVRTDGERGHVVHYLIDFSSAFGAGSNARREIAPQNPRAGNEYVIDWGPIGKAFVTFGLWDRAWRGVQYRTHPEIGNIEAEFFRPETWKPEYPNPAFDRLLPEDGFWAARQLERFTDDAVRAVVHTGGFRDAAAEAHLAEVLIARRNKIVDHYYRQVSPLVDFRVVGGALAFEHGGQRRGLGPVEGYDAEWFAFDNATGASTALGPAVRAEGPRLALPASESAFLRVRLRARTGEPGWRKAVDVYLRGQQVVGIEREN